MGRSRSSPNAAASRTEPRCLIGQGMREEVSSLLEESQLEREATLVELPVMFIAKEELQLDEQSGLLQKGENGIFFYRKLGLMKKYCKSQSYRRLDIKIDFRTDSNPFEFLYFSIKWFRNSFCAIDSFLLVL